ncbi:MAG: hypothetical protein AAFX05_10830, partial [Planctomycetota bacterium]
MKLKGISVVEQHVEKIVLLVFALLAIGIFILQFDIIGSGNEIEIPGRGSVAPGRADDLVRQEAEAVEDRLNRSDDLESPPEIPPIRELIVDAIRAGQPPEDALALAPTWGEDTFTPDAVPDVDRPGQRYVEIAPPAPADVAVHTFGGSIDPFEPAETPELLAMLPPEQPYDLRATTVQATFDAAAFREQLSSSPDPSVRALPRPWYLDRVELLDVELLRQRQMDDGTWGATEVVPALPGRFTFRDRLASELTTRDLTDMLREEADAREEIRRPNFYRMIAGEPWVWPALAMERQGGAEAQRVKRLVAQHRDLSRRIEDLNERIERARNQRENAPDRSPGPPDRGGDRDRSSSSGPGSSWPRAQSEQRDVVADLERQREEFEQQLDAVQGELELMGLDQFGMALRVEEIPEFEERNPDLTDSGGPEQVTIWAHDITGEPGATYRYALRVQVTNPLFGNDAALSEDQVEAASSPAVASEASAWSEPTFIAPRQVYFVRSATGAAPSLGGQRLRKAASATVEIYTFLYGYWRGDSVQIRAGDQIAAELELPELPLFEVDATT